MVTVMAGVGVAVRVRVTARNRSSMFLRLSRG